MLLMASSQCNLSSRHLYCMVQTRKALAHMPVLVAIQYSTHISMQIDTKIGLTCRSSGNKKAAVGAGLSVEGSETEYVPLLIASVIGQSSVHPLNKAQID